MMLKFTCIEQACRQAARLGFESLPLHGVGVMCRCVIYQYGCARFRQRPLTCATVQAVVEPCGLTLLLLCSRCGFRDYIHECVGNVCPRQVSHTYPDAVTREWTAGDY